MLRLVVLDSRHLLRVRSSTELAKTYLEFFTRRGTFMGELSLDFGITSIAPTSVPYQLQALSAPTASSPAQVVLISLKPFRINWLRLPIQPRSVSPLPWGSFVRGSDSFLLLDSSAQPLTRLRGLPAAAAIAAIDPRHILFATGGPQKHKKNTRNGDTQKTPPADSFSASGRASLLVADVRTLDLGVIF